MECSDRTDCLTPLYRKLAPLLNKSSSLQDFDRLIRLRENLFCTNLNHTIKALLVSRIFDLNNKSQHLLFVTCDCNKAEEYYDDLVILLGKENVFWLPDYETLPYEERSPHFSIRAKRLDVLEQALSQRPFVLVVSVKSLLRKILPPRIIKKNVIHIGLESEIEPDKLLSRLIGLGYEMQSEVSKVGEISKRGGILDIYSPSHSHPVRLEFFGDVVTSCRYFDPFTQVSMTELNHTIKIIPAREVSLDDISTPEASRWEKIHSKGLYEGIEQDVTLLYDDCATILDYLTDNSLVNSREQTSGTKPIIILDEYPLLKRYAADLKAEIEKQRIIAENNKKKRSAGDVIPEPRMLFADFEDIQVISEPVIRFSALQADSKDSVLSCPGENRLQLLAALRSRKEWQSVFKAQPVINRDISILQDIIEERLNANWSVIIQSDNISQSRRMQEMLKEFSGRIDYEIGVLHRGFELAEAKLALYTDHEIFNRYKQKKVQESYPAGETIIDYESLKSGDYIVHVEHGIGIYEGLKLMEVNKSKIECLVIRYAGEGRVYVPTYQLRLVSRYVSEEGIVPEIHKLGGKRWEQAKSRAKKQIELIADDLVKLYAERSLRKGISFVQDTVWQNEMEDSFIYEDTPDQRRATEEIKADMELSSPMERLLCGDVGFGKTEVAIRASFKAVTSGWQVAVLVPTTLLAEQHYIVFRERLAQYPIRIAMLSRFRTPAQIKEDLRDVKEGKIDIAIGTHRLLSKDVEFKSLGLLIIDEEHRFGVRHKDKIRKLKSNVDTLYMSATPIPRTLNMALVRLKDMSLMLSSPKSRLPIRTNIIPFDMSIIKDAIIREIDRGGQILFIHNRIDTIDSIAEEIRSCVPGIRAAVGHGQLPERQLENIMLDFYEHKYDILVATTIIESGIDIPNANTIIINRADMFGLAQLYQIRGRVGRSNRRAYAYLVVPRHIQYQARKRLEALSEYNTLGSGYQIAMRDLELRGAGTLLGTKQSGIINSVGFNYYNKLLAEAVESLLAGKEMSFKEERQIEKTRIDADFFFPADYMPDEKMRLHFYRRMLEFDDIAQFEEMALELKDRFGNIPEPARKGLLFYSIKMLSEKSNLDSFKINGTRIIIGFNKQIFRRTELGSRHSIQTILKKVKYPVEFDDSKQSLTMTIVLPEEFIDSKEEILLTARDILTALQPQ